MMQASLKICCELATGLHIDGYGICGVWECIKTFPSWTLVAGKADQTIYMQNTQTLAKHTRDSVEILVSSMLTVCFIQDLFFIMKILKTFHLTVANILQVNFNNITEDILQNAIYGHIKKSVS